MENEHIHFCMPELKFNIRKIIHRKTASYRGLHLHKEIELVRADKGKTVCVINDKTVVLNQGEVAFINGGVIHKIAPMEEISESCYIQINLSDYIGSTTDFEEKYLNYFINSNITNQFEVFREDSELKKIFSRMENEFIKKEPGYEEYIKAYIFEIAAFMRRYGFLADNNGMVSKNKIKKILPAIKYTAENYMNKIYLKDVAKASNMDKFYFCKLFKDITGEVYTDYVNFVRLLSAEELLSETDKNISEIAFECGFSSVQYFNRIMKSHRGCTPKEYRKMVCKLV